MKSIPQVIQDKGLQSVVEAFCKPDNTPDLTTTVGKLKHLRHVVERIDPAKFRMEAIAMETACGTVGCMLGWAAMDPTFNTTGLSLRATSMGLFSLVTKAEETFFGWPHAAADFFGMREVDACDVFSGDIQKHDAVTSMRKFTIAHGLARIDRMIARYEGK